MEIIFEILIELILEGTVEASKNKKIPKVVRYPLIFLIVLLFIGVIGLVLFTGILAYQKINRICGILLIIIATVLVITSIIQFRQVYLTKRTKL